MLFIVPHRFHAPQFGFSIAYPKKFAYLWHMIIHLPLEMTLKIDSTASTSGEYPLFTLNITIKAKCIEVVLPGRVSSIKEIVSVPVH